MKKIFKKAAIATLTATVLLNSCAMPTDSTKNENGTKEVDKSVKEARHLRLCNTFRGV